MSKVIRIHMINFKAPTPRCEYSVCGVALGNIAYTIEPKRVTCRRCLRLMKKRGTYAA